MSTLNFDEDFAGLGYGSEAYALLEDASGTGGSSNVEAEVKINVTSAEDEQADAVADDAAEDVEAVADAGAELFKDMSRMLAIRDVLAAHESISPAFYEYINGDRQLSRQLGIQLPGCESLSSSGNNADVVNKIIPSIERLITDGGNGRSSMTTNFKTMFDILAARIARMDNALNEVIVRRGQRIAALIAKLEQDEAPEEVTVTTVSPEEADSKTDTPESEETTADVNTAEECLSLINSAGVEHLDSSPFMQSLDNAVNGRTVDLRDIVDASRTTMRDLIAFRNEGRQSRKIRVNKDTLLRAMYDYGVMLEDWNNIRKLNYACGNIAKMANQTSITDKASMEKVVPMFQALTATQNYVQTTKKVMDNVYYNLRYLAVKMLAQ